jgi:hypothetical protein
MKRIAWIGLVLAVVSWTSPRLHAQSPDTPVTVTGTEAGLHFGYGWYPLVDGFWYWNYYGTYPGWYNAFPYGYSYWAYYNYNFYYSTFGVIAYSPQHDWAGIAWGAPTLTHARNWALYYCTAPGCEPVVWVRGGCAAVARGTVETEEGPLPGPVAWGIHGYRYGAQSRALQACHQSGQELCSIRAWVCSN